MKTFDHSKKFKRWQLAQKHQQANQLHKKAAFARIDPKSIYLQKTKFAGSVFKHVSKYKNLTHKSMILEVGSGPHGINFYFPTGIKVALDPLAHFYHKEFDFLQEGSNSLICRGMGEYLPFKSKRFDWVINDNVLDHTLDAKLVLLEIHRILKDDGIFLLSVNLHHFVFRIFSLAFKILYSMNIIPNTPNYKTHTYFFTPPLLKRLIKKGKFKIISAHIPLRSPAGNPKLKRFKPFKNVYSTFICRKQ
jgi:SAM-dependent methyltransferase